jgi:general secretion pathway protein M
MTSAFASWWRLRTPREQRLLAAMALLAALVFAWLLVLRPLWRAEEDARARLDAAVLQLAEARAREAAAARGGAAPAAALAEPADALVSRTAAETGFADGQVRGEGPGRAAIAIPAARPQALLAWIGRLESQGLAVHSLSLAANSDRTLNAEIVFAEARP